MPYIGRDLNRGNYLKLDDISSSFDSSTTTFNLTVGGSAFTPGSAFSILVSVGGVIQEPESAYQVNNSEITFANAPTAQDSFFCIALGVSLGIGVPGNGTVNGTQMAKPFSYDGFFYLNDTNNRVGINSSSPTVALDVNGNAKISGILTAGSYSGPISNPSGISTFYDVRVINNLTVEGTTTTLDTDLIGVDRVEVAANSNSIVGVAVTQSGTADIINLFDGNTEVLTVTDGGNVGIGTDNPGSAQVRIHRDGLNKILQQWGGNQGSTAGQRFMELYSPSTDSANDYFRFQTGNAIKFKIDAKNALAINSSANIGIGTDSPDVQLDINGDTSSNTQIRIRKATAGNYGAIKLDRDASGTAGGQLGIAGASSHFVTTASQHDIVLRSEANLLFGVGGSNEKLRIASNGYVGINQTSPITRLDVKQNNGVAYDGNAQSAAFNVARFLNTSGHVSGGTYTGLQFNISGDSQNRICSIGMITQASNSKASSLVFHTDDGGNRTEKLRIDSGGRSLFKTNGSQTTPVADNNVPVQIAESTESMCYFGANKGNSYGSIFGHHTAYGGTVIRNITGDDIVFMTNNSQEKLRISENGTLTSTASNNGSIVHSFKNTAATAGSSAMTVEQHFNFNRTGGGIDVSAARIVAGKEREWVGGASNQDGYLAFFTCLNETPAEKLRIKSDGKVGIGLFNNLIYQLELKTNSTNLFRINNSGETGQGSHDAYIIAGGAYYQNPVIGGSTIKFNTFNGSTFDTRVRITSDGDLVINDTTADGNVHPDTKLHVKGGITFRELTSASENALPAITQWSSSGTGQDLVIGARSNNGAVLFYTGNAGTDGDWGASNNDERLRITSSGTVNIGGNYSYTNSRLQINSTSFPETTEYLTVFKAGVANGNRFKNRYIKIRNNYTGSAHGGVPIVWEANADGSNNKAYGAVVTESNGDIRFLNAAATSEKAVGTDLLNTISEKLRITTNGTVKIKTGVLELGSTSGQDNYIYSTNAAGIIYQADENGHKFQTYVGGWQDRLIIQDDGQVQIPQTTQSTTTTTGALKVSGGIGVAKNIICGGALEVQNNTLTVTSGTPNIVMAVPSGGLDSRIYNDGNGNFIIGHGTNSNTPTERLRIESDGKTLIERSVTSTSGVHPALQIETTTNGSANSSFATGIDFFQNGIHKKRLGITKGNLGTGGGDWAFYKDQGNNVHTYMFRDGDMSIVDGNLKLASGHGIDFSATANTSSGSSHNELLDDYEEGQWSPGAKFGGTAATVTSGGKYTKIGNLVHITYQVTINNLNSGSGIILCTGLPFTPSQSPTYSHGIVQGNSNKNLPSTAGSTMPYIQSGQTEFRILYDTPTDHGDVNETMFDVSTTFYGNATYFTNYV